MYFSCIWITAILSTRSATYPYFHPLWAISKTPMRLSHTPFWFCVVREELTCLVVLVVCAVPFHHHNRIAGMNTYAVNQGNILCSYIFAIAQDTRRVQTSGWFRLKEEDLRKTNHECLRHYRIQVMRERIGKYSGNLHIPTQLAVIIIIQDRSSHSSGANNGVLVFWRKRWMMNKLHLVLHLSSFI